MSAMAEAPSWFFSRQGKQEGPIPQMQLRDLIRNRQLQLTDMVWREGMAQWLPVQSIPDLSTGTANGPPPIPAATVGYYAPPIAQPGDDLGQNAGVRLLIPVGRSGWAIAAGYLGLFSVLGCPGPIALVISIVAIRDIRRHPDRHGMGRAIFGLVMGILGTLALLGFAVISVMNRR
jgi:hypothetical protein